MQYQNPLPGINNVFLLYSLYANFILLACTESARISGSDRKLALKTASELNLYARKDSPWSKNPILCGEIKFIFPLGFFYWQLIVRVTGIPVVIGCFSPYQSFISFLSRQIQCTSRYDNYLGLISVIFRTFYSNECRMQSDGSNYVSLCYRFPLLYPSFCIETDQRVKNISYGNYNATHIQKYVLRLLLMLTGVV